MSLTSKVFGTIGTILVLGTATPLAAAPAVAQTSDTASQEATRSGEASDPVEVIRERNERVQEILKRAGDPVDDATREELKDVINGLMDFEELSRRALSRHWNDRSEKEQAEFVEVFRELVRNSSVRKLGIYRADSVQYEPAEMSEDEAVVRSVAYEKGETVEIVYHMHRVGDEWLAYDFVVDGSSTLRTYRDSFQRQLDRTSYSDMYQRLVERLEQERGTGG